MKVHLFGDGEHGAVVREAATLRGMELVASEHDAEAFHVAFVGLPPMTGRRQFILNQRRIFRHWATIIHPSAVVSSSARIAAGVYIGPRVVINAGATIGEHAVINSGAIIEHHCQVGHETHVCPGAILGGGVVVDYAAWIGLGAMIRDHIHIGRQACIGMGAVVTKDVPACVTVVGCPARPWPLSSSESPSERPEVPAHQGPSRR